MQRVSTTVVALAGERARACLQAFERAANVRTVLVEPEQPALDRAAAAWRAAQGTRLPYLLHDADPLEAVAGAWVRRFDAEGVAGELEVAVGETLARWRARDLELPPAGCCRPPAPRPRSAGSSPASPAAAGGRSSTACSTGWSGSSQTRLETRSGQVAPDARERITLHPLTAAVPYREEPRWRGSVRTTMARPCPNTATSSSTSTRRVGAGSWCSSWPWRAGSPTAAACRARRGRLARGAERVALLAEAAAANPCGPRGSGTSGSCVVRPDGLRGDRRAPAQPYRVAAASCRRRPSTSPSTHARCRRPPSAVKNAAPS